MEVDSKKIGRFFIISFPEQIPRDDTLYFILDNRIGGIILFADHCCNIDNLRDWLTDFKKSAGNGFIVSVDQEGGRVCRFTSGFPDLEAPRYYGEGDKVDQYRSDLSRVCEKLHTIGINLNLVPTVDLMNSQKGHVLDSRTFSDDPQKVSHFAQETIAIHKVQGILTCGKHFPGLGRSIGDPHHGLTTSNLAENDFFDTELLPFKEIIDIGVDAVMVTHLSAPRIDDCPAVVSEKMICGWLKDKLNFSGPVITDDLLMAAVADIDDGGGIAERSFSAGADLLLFGQDLERTREAFDSFTNAWLANQLDRQRIVDAQGRIEEFRRKIIG
jgi:beta-N-acetylhexosaminidase